MVVGIHQPNYLPGISYFAKIWNSDTFIFLDSVQYSKGNWTNRNRIKTLQGELMLTVPILKKGKLTQKISEVQINLNDDWRKKHLKSIVQNYSKAPFFHKIMSIIEELLNKEWKQLSKMNCEIIIRICNLLGIERNFLQSSKMGRDDLQSTDMLIYLIKTAGGSSYLSGAGGRKYMEVEKFPGNGLDLHFMHYKPVPYRQQFGDFIPNLSIVDLLFNEGLDTLQIIKESAEIS